MLSRNTAAASRLCLQRCGKDHIFVAKASGARSKRPGLNACLLEELQQGAVLLVLRLDRLSHSMPHLVTLVEELRDQGASGTGCGEGTPCQVFQPEEGVRKKDFLTYHDLS